MQSAEKFPDMYQNNSRDGKHRPLSFIIQWRRYLCGRLGSAKRRACSCTVQLKLSRLITRSLQPPPKYDVAMLCN
jgi:hypothetical protein